MPPWPNPELDCALCGGLLVSDREVFPNGVTVILTKGTEDLERVVDDEEGVEGAVAALDSEVCRKASTLRGPHL